MACRNLALGIGIQNFPEGLAVSLPLHRAGYSKWQAFWYVFAVGAAISAVVAGLGARAARRPNDALAFKPVVVFAASADLDVNTPSFFPFSSVGGLGMDN